jgi:hypothetical protein
VVDHGGDEIGAHLLVPIGASSNVGDVVAVHDPELRGGLSHRGAA